MTASSESSLKQLRRLLPAVAFAASIFALPAMGQTLRDAVEGAWRLNPDIKSLEARRHQATAQRGAGEAFFPAAPAVTLRHISDTLGKNVGRREYEAEFGVPLWLPGQGTATIKAADTLSARIDADIVVRRLAIAGEVRTALWSVALAERRTQLVRQRLKITRQLEADTARTTQAGETSEADLQLARAEALAIAVDLRDEELAFADAKLVFQTLTGMMPPKAIPEPEISEPPLDRHPLIVATRLGVQTAQAQRKLVDIGSRDYPEVGLTARRERDARGESFGTIVGMSVRIPFSVDAVNGPKRAEATIEVVKAEAEQNSAARTVESDIRQARSSLQAAKDRLSISRDRAAAQKARLFHIEKARKSGEIGLVELVRAQAAVFEADLARTTTEIQLGAARARLNQSIGVAP